jgi:putative FmdB family regulatory protein
MPIYDYECTKCSHCFEEYQKVNTRHLPCKPNCSNCGEANSIQIKIGNAAICDPIRIGVKKTDKGFQEVMAKIKEAHPKFKPNDR